MPIRETLTRTPSMGANRYAFVTGDGSTRFRIVLTGQALERIKAMGDVHNEAALIVKAELRRLRAAIEATVRGHAPTGVGQGTDRYGNTYGREERLADTIRGQVVGNTILLRMAWWGFINIEGRGPMGPRADGKAYAIPQPDGSVIFRKRVRGAKPNPFLQRADRDLYRSGAYEQTMQVVAERIAALMGAMEATRSRIGSLPDPDTALGARYYRGLRIGAKPQKITRGAQKKAFSEARKVAMRRGQILRSRRRTRLAKTATGIANQRKQRMFRSMRSILANRQALTNLDKHEQQLKSLVVSRKISREEYVKRMAVIRQKQNLLEKRLRGVLGENFDEVMATRAQELYSAGIDYESMKSGGLYVETRRSSTKRAKKAKKKRRR